MIARRGFLSGILALSAAPAIVRAQSLMPVAPRIIVPQGSGDYVRLLGIEMLRSGLPVLQLHKLGQARPLPAPAGGTIVFRRWAPPSTELILPG